MSAPEPHLSRSCRPLATRSAILLAGRRVGHCEALLQSRRQAHDKPRIHQQDPGPRVHVSVALAAGARADHRGHGRIEGNAECTAEQAQCTGAIEEVLDARPEWLRNKARPYLFSNTLAPAVVGATLKCLEIISESTHLRDKLMENTAHFRAKMVDAGFDIVPGIHPIAPIMFSKYENSAELAVKFADRMLEEGIYVIAFSFPVVPRKMDRIRVQISAGHSKEQIDRCITAFIKVGKELKVIS